MPAGRWENDWINLWDPEFSRILRAPLAKSRPLRSRLERGPVWAWACAATARPIRGRACVCWSTAMHTPCNRSRLSRVSRSFRTRRKARRSSASPRRPIRITRTCWRSSAGPATRHWPRPGWTCRVRRSLPGRAGSSIRRPCPRSRRPPTVAPGEDGVVHVTWERSARTIGLEAELHRSASELLAEREDASDPHGALPVHRHRGPAGRQFYALVLISGDRAEPAGLHGGHRACAGPAARTPGPQGHAHVLCHPTTVASRGAGMPFATCGVRILPARCGRDGRPLLAGLPRLSQPRRRQGAAANHARADSPGHLQRCRHRVAGRLQLRGSGGKPPRNRGPGKLAGHRRSHYHHGSGLLRRAGPRHARGALRRRRSCPARRAARPA